MTATTDTVRALLTDGRTDEALELAGRCTGDVTALARWAYDELTASGDDAAADAFAALA